ncbi:GntR family transcriptional regulator [Cupriavidus gilardii]|uniref:GntR family transcriptional regulator n=1 Tax=Cupriavidus gilardii TaxID=82541 RepID=A0A6N1BA94_9BURK|nr:MULTISPECIES: GntR family transcriptional regulator [Cupriavidus]QQE09409.1 GntR family transcriptional regulator [Cupriavidus sp. ISTL7]ESJ04704.1 GntR family transcriptional regulator [Cupriavidus sp. HPC(L)]KAB0594877.1 GntR family transcriptional regulator [Cupriavidus gilardii]MCD9122720.1 GntR family transcriptional regulator [Cupriavidus sp. UGS-1]MCT9014237.1 GntR family transcriptional regulator [Cupriavidus gilardii]
MSLRPSVSAAPDQEVVSLGASHSPLFALVTDKLRERILKGDYEPGERLVENKLSAELGVSRIPVREALRALASEGLVLIEPRRGASVAKLSPDIVREMVEVRATLEGLNAKLAAQRRDPALIAELEAVLQQGMEAAAQGKADELLTLNSRFHEVLGNIAANSVLQEMMRSLRERTAVLFGPANTVRARQNWDEHAQILQAVIAGDADLAALLAARHVYSAAKAAELPVGEQHAA